MIFFGKDIPNPECAPRGRIAPSPTGFLHLGNAWSFWVAWLGARSVGGEVVLRMEDIDPARSRPQFAQAVMRDLTWLGLDWDYGSGGPSDALYTQSGRGAVYVQVLDFLRTRGVIYPCYCTRKDLRDLAGAPHMEDAGAPYPGTCRTLTHEGIARFEAVGRRPSLRLRCPAGESWDFTDRVCGEQSVTLAECGGDFAVQRSDGVYAYQLATVTDDMTMGITQVVRGNDILSSTPRQRYLYSLLGVKPPAYAHLPLVMDENGERLAKRHASLTLESLRNAGVYPQTLLGWLAVESGLRNEYAPLQAAEGAMGFSFMQIKAAALRLPPDPVKYFLTLQQKAHR